MNELAATQEIWRNSYSGYSDSEEALDYAAMEEEADIIKTFLEKKVEDLVKEYLAQHAEDLIDLSIKTYILRKKNDKIERKKYTLKTTAVKK